MRMFRVAIVATIVFSQQLFLQADTSVVAHRGLLRHSPENTLCNFRSCLKLRLGFEVDVQRSKDGRLVCIHDSTLDRTTNGKGQVADLTWEQMKRLDAGSWFGKSFHGERIPSWNQVLREIAIHRNAQVVIAVDLKADNIEADTVRLAKEHGVLDRLLFIGSAIRDVEVRRKLRTADAKTHVACVANNRNEFASALIDKHADWVYFRYVPSSNEIGRVHKAKKKAFIAGATVAGRQPSNWQECVRVGMDAILTDYALPLAAQLRAGRDKSPKTSSTSLSANKTFKQLAAQFLKEFPALSPVSATSIGDHRFDKQLDDISQTARLKELAFCKLYLERLARIDPSKLTRDNQVDYLVLQHDLRRSIWRIETLQEWAWNPLQYTRLAGSSIYKLMSRNFAPIETRLMSAAARLQQLPRFYKQVRSTLEPKRVPEVHAKTAVNQNRGLLSMIDNMIRPHLDQLPASKREELTAAIDVAAAAVEEQQVWLESKLVPNAGGDFRLGPRLYDEKLAHVLGINMTRQQFRDRAENELRRVRNEMYRIARPIYEKQHPKRKLSNNATRDQQQAVIEATLELAYAERPKRGGVVTAAKKSMEITTKFLRERDLISIPDDPLDIIVMPEFLRGVSFAYCDSPGPLEVGLRTYYAVAPIPKKWNDKQTDSFLREYNIRSVYNLTIHEAMPGHFLQLAHSNRYPSKLRAVLSSGVFIEGWACYTEQMMADEGFLDRDPLMRLIMLKWYLRSIANAMMDQAIHVDGMRREEAMRLMMEDTFQEEREAAAKWVRAQLTSTQLSTYFVGYQEHREMRRAAEKKWGDKFSLKEYHDRAISFGSPPPHFARALLLDEEIIVAKPKK